MSRIGRRPIRIPAKVAVKVDGRTVSVEGPLGKLHALLPVGVSLEVEPEVARVVAPAVANRSNGGFQGLTRAVLANLVEGVVHGFKRDLEIVGVGFKFEAAGEKLTVHAGYSHKVVLQIPANMKVVLDKSQTKMALSSPDRQLLGQFAAQVRGVKEPEPYKGKGIKYADETVRRKVGKAGTK